MEKFATDGIVSDMKLSGVPPTQLKVSYGGISVEPGMTLTPTQVQSPPNIEFDGDSGAFYTLIMNDPDAPSRADPKFREWHHWLVVNIPGNQVSKGDTQSDYIGSGPPKDTGLHRYVFLLYRQPGKITFDGLPKLIRCGDDRGGQKVADFLTKWGISELVAGNYFVAEFDDAVPKLYEELAKNKKEKK